MRILVAEDEADLGRTLQKALAEDGYAVDWTQNGAAALDKACATPYDTILLDVMLPGRSGLAVLAALRERGIRTPVLILTARDGVDDKVRGLDVGADDYMTKPFALTELLARVRALIRRASPDPVSELAAGPLVVDTCARVVRHGETVIDLTAREYAILELLARRKGTVVTRSAIYDHVYDDREDTLSNVVDVFVAALRRKLGADVIRTRRDTGTSSMPDSLRVRLLLWYAGILVAVIVMVGAAVCLVTWRSRLASVDAELTVRADAIASSVERGADDAFDVELPAEVTAYFQDAPRPSLLRGVEHTGPADRSLGSRRRRSRSAAAGSARRRQGARDRGCSARAHGARGPGHQRRLG